MITDSTAAYIELQFAFEDITTGETMSIFAGCDRTFETCKDKFSNGINFGGCPYIPTENVFTEGVE